MYLLSLTVSVAIVLSLISKPASTMDVEIMEFEDELADLDYICHWSIWTETACQQISGVGCRADLRRRCVCLKFAGIPSDLNSSDYKTRTCSFGTLQERQDKPNGRCDSNCQLLDAFFRRIDGLHGAWCAWSDWQRSTCHVGPDGLMEGYQTSQRQCFCPPTWLEGDACHGSDSRAGNCRESLNNVPSRFADIWLVLFNNWVIGVVLPTALVAYFCCLAGPIRQGLQLGRLQSGAVIAELRVHRVRHLAAIKRRAKERRAAAAASSGSESTDSRSPSADERVSTTGDATTSRIVRGREATKLRRRRKFFWEN